MPTTIKPFNGQSEYTIFNNYILDHVMPKTTPNGWKCLCFIIRKTKGWHKLSDDLSFSQIKKGTGIKSDPTISAALKELEDSKFILVKRNDGQWNSNTYTLNTTLEIIVEQVGSTIESIVEPTIENEVESTIDSIDTKETLKQNKINKERKNQRPPVIPAIQIFVEETGKYCLSKPQIKAIENRVGTEPTRLEQWRVVVKTWVLRGYKPTNADGMLSWLDQGIPQYQNGATNGHRPITQQTQQIQTTEGAHQTGTPPSGHRAGQAENENQQRGGLSEVSRGLSAALKARARTGGG